MIMVVDRPFLWLVAVKVSNFNIINSNEILTVAG